MNSTISNSTRENDPVYQSLIGALGGLAVLFNGPLLIVLLKSKTPVFHSRMNYLIGNLALADFLTGISAIISALEVLPTVHFFMIWTTIGASFITLLFMSIERLIVITYPLTWPFILTTRRTLISITTTWFIAITCGLFVHFFLLPAQFALIVIFEISIFVVIILHGIIFGYLQKQRICSQKFEKIPRKEVDLAQASQSQATTVLLILVVILIFTVLPNIIVLQLLISYSFGFTSGFSLHCLMRSHYFLYPIELLNFVVNPIVYAWRLKRYRKALAETFVSFVGTFCTITDKRKTAATARMV